MKRIRITVRHNPVDPADDLRFASRLRRDLWAHSPVEIDPDSPRHGTHRDADHNAYFEFATNYFPEVQRVLDDYGHSERANASIVMEDDGPPCANCGNITGPTLPSVCPTCKFRDISPCPHCRQEIARQAYLSVSGDVFKCPTCQNRVRFRLNDPLFDTNGDYNQPTIIVEEAVSCAFR